MCRHAFPTAALCVIVALGSLLAPGADDPPASKQRAPFRGRSGAAPRTPPPAAGAPHPSSPAAQATLIPEAVRRHPEGPAMEVAPIDRERRAAVAEAAERIDALLASAWARDGVEPEAIVDDADFVRRAWLTLGGRIPTASEVLTFLQSKDDGKRGELVDSILESPDWVSHSYNGWADTLRLKEEPVFDLWCAPYLAWVKRSIAENRPYDAWVHEMLTADGKAWENPAVGYQLRDDAMPLAYVSNTMRVFLGTQIGCAECHDHPYAPWTQRQFYELAAFTAGTETGRQGPRKLADGKSEEPSKTTIKVRAFTEELNGRVRKAAQGGPAFDGAAYMCFLRANRTKIGFRPLEMRLPHDYRYRDGRPGETVEPKLPWGDAPPGEPGSDSRRTFAAWVTSRDNRQFASTIANRLWKFCFGVGLVEPIDDFSDSNPPSNPELLAELTDLVLALDFDSREFVRTVVSTKAWQRRAMSYDPTAEKPFSFAGPALRRMSAEQVWDSILTLIARDRWAYQRRPQEDWEVLREFDVTAENPDFDAGYVHCMTVPKRLQPAETMEATVRFKQWYLAPASELPMPQRVTHFLREFGQGDRETIDGNRTVATVAQVLEMLHGSYATAVLDPGSLLMETVAANPPARAVDIVFVSILSRLPDDDEKRFLASVMASAPSPRDGLNDVVYALLNTREFLFVR